jgi:hypothetical protein
LIINYGGQAASALPVYHHGDTAVGHAGGHLVIALEARGRVAIQRRTRGTRSVEPDGHSGRRSGAGKGDPTLATVPTGPRLVMPTFWMR